MRLLKIELEGLTRFRERVGVDLEGIGGELVAIVGENGAGKTTILEALPALLFGKFPSRPKALYDYAPGKSAFIEALFDGGLRARVNLRPGSRKSEAYLWKDGEPLVNGKILDYQQEIPRLFGTPELLLASVFAAQNKAGSFLGMKRADRRAFFSELLGIGRIADLHGGAGRYRLKAEGNVADTRGKLELYSSGCDPDAVREEVARIEEDLAAARVSLEEARKAHEAAAEERRLDQERVDSRQVLWENVRKTKADRDAKHRALLDVRRGKDRIAGQAEDKVKALGGAGLAAQADRNERDLEDARRRHSREKKRIEDAAARELGAWRREKALLERQALDQLEGWKKRRAELARRAGLEASCTVAGAWMPVLESGVSLVDEREPLPVKLADTCPLREDARAAAGELEALGPEPIGVTVEIPEPPEPPVGEMNELDARLTKAEQAYNARRKQLEEGREQLTAEEEKVRQWAEGELKEASEAEAAADEALGLAQGAYDDAELAAKQAGEIDLGESERKVRKTAEAVRSAEDLVERRIGDASTARQRVEIAFRRLGEKKGLLRQEEADVAELGDWGLLHDSLGPSGLQALLIANAAPEVTEIGNELLEGCYGPRFALRLETLREKVKRRGEYLEVFDVRVSDRGVDRTAEDLSGGEQVVISEALGLALAIFNGRKARIKWETIFRDETSGALDPESADRYVAMLRKALDVGGFKQCVFVAHLPQVYEAADARVLLEDGRARVS